MNKITNGLRYFRSKFPDEEACLKHLVGRRWPTGEVKCPYCGSSIATEKLTETIECPECHKEFNAMTGTVYEGDIPLLKWYILVYMVVLCEGEVPVEMAVSELDLPQDTCVEMLAKIRPLTSKVFKHEGQ